MAFPRHLPGNERRATVSDYTAPHPISVETQQAIDGQATRGLSLPLTAGLRWGEKSSATMRATGDLGLLQRFVGFGVTRAIRAGNNQALPATSVPAYADSSVRAIIEQAGMVRA